MKLIKTAVIFVRLKGLIKRRELFMHCKDNTKSKTGRMISNQLTRYKSILRKVAFISAVYFTHSKDGAISKLIDIIRTYSQVFKDVMRMSSENIKLSFGLVLFTSTAQFVPSFDHKTPWIRICHTAINFLEVLIDKANIVLNDNLVGGSKMKAEKR